MGSFPGWLLDSITNMCRSLLINLQLVHPGAGIHQLCWQSMFDFMLAESALDSLYRGNPIKP